MDPDIRLVGQDVCFLHWPADPEAVAAHLPDTLSVDTYDGRAWLTALVQEVASVGPAAVDVAPLSPFPQLDFRTYVRHGGDPGVYFISCDTGRTLNRVLGAAAFDLPFTAADIEWRDRGDRFVVRSHRDGNPPARFAATYRPTGEASPAEPDSLAEFLVERHRYFTPAEGPIFGPGERTGLIAGDVERDPWQLAPVDVSIRHNTLFEAVGLAPPTTEPTAHYAPQFESVFTGTERVE